MLPHYLKKGLRLKNLFISEDGLMFVIVEWKTDQSEFKSTIALIRSKAFNKHEAEQKQQEKHWPKEITSFSKPDSQFHLQNLRCLNIDCKTTNHFCLECSVWHRKSSLVENQKPFGFMFFKFIKPKTTTTTTTSTSEKQHFMAFVESSDGFSLMGWNSLHPSHPTLSEFSNQKDQKIILGFVDQALILQSPKDYYFFKV